MIKGWAIGKNWTEALAGIAGIAGIASNGVIAVIMVTSYQYQIQRCDFVRIGRARN